MDLIICISIHFPGDADGTGPGPHFEGHFLSQTLYSHPIQPANGLAVNPGIYYYYYIFLKQPDLVL